MNKDGWILLGLAAAMTGVAMLKGAPWWAAVPFGFLYILAFLAVGYFAAGGPADVFWSSMLDMVTRKK